MKKLFLSIIAVSLFSCSKNGYKPDERQADCQKCISYLEKSYDQGGEPFETDTAYFGYLCDDQLTNFSHNVRDTSIRICNSNGELLHWEHIVNKIIKN